MKPSNRPLKLLAADNEVPGLAERLFSSSLQRH
jgi:hypothetical protein